VSGSISDQLLQLGLVTKVRVKQAQTPVKPRTPKRRATPNTPPPQSAATHPGGTAASKPAPSRSTAAPTEAQRKAQTKKLSRLIHQHRLPRPAPTSEAAVSHQFTAKGTVKRLVVSAEQQTQLTLGQLAIVCSDQGYSLVNAAIAHRLLATHASSMVVWNRTPKATADVPADEPDPYADYPVPDDLTW